RSSVTRLPGSRDGRRGAATNTVPAQTISPTTPRAALPYRLTWWFVAVGIALSFVTLLDRTESTRSFVFDVLALVAAAGAVYGILRNRPDQRVSWLYLAFGLVLLAAGDIVYDVVTRGMGADSGYPWADVLYLAAYPFLAYALYQLARRNFRRD